jgi:type IV pilus assembly protein PilC
MVRVGEISGTLDSVLARLANYLERETALKQKVQTLLIYPAFVVTLTVIVTTVLLMFVVPVFSQVYRAAGVSLPLPTRVLVAVSQQAQWSWPVLAALGVAGAVVMRQASARAWLRNAAGNVVARIPRANAVANTVQITQFVRALSAMQASGVPVLTALDVIMGATPDPRMQEAIGRLKSAVNRGQSLSEGMRSDPLFPPMVHRIVVMGEESGRLDAMLDRAAESMERETDFAIKRLVALAEPTLTLALAAVVGGVLLALYLPIFGLTEILGVE